MEIPIPIQAVIMTILCSLVAVLFNDFRKSIEKLTLAVEKQTIFMANTQEKTQIHDKRLTELEKYIPNLWFVHKYQDKLSDLINKEK